MRRTPSSNIHRIQMDARDWFQYRVRFHSDKTQTYTLSYRIQLSLVALVLPSNEAPEVVTLISAWGARVILSRITTEMRSCWKWRHWATSYDGEDHLRFGGERGEMNKSLHLPGRHWCSPPCAQSIPRLTDQTQNCKNNFGIWCRTLSKRNGMTKSANVQLNIAYFCVYCVCGGERERQRGRGEYSITSKPARTHTVHKAKCSRRAQTIRLYVQIFCFIC